MHGTVTTTTWTTPTLVSVELGGPGLDGFEMPESTDAYVNLAIPPAGVAYGPVFDPREVHDTQPREAWPARRRYTVRRWDPAARLLTLEFVVHGAEGAAGPWAAAAREGDVLVFNGPGSGYVPDPDAAWHLMVGDESALPAIAASLEALQVSAPAASAVVRLVCDGPEHEVPLRGPEGLDLRWLHRSEADREPLLAAVEALAWREGGVDVFVHGEAQEVRGVRRHLVVDRGLPAKAMSCSPYWRRGMTDEAWRSVKKEFTAAMDADAA